MNFTQFGRCLDLDSDTYWKQKEWRADHPDRATLFSKNIHWGQFKLFMSELEFFTTCINSGIDINDSVIIYVGSAPGDHTNYFMSIFKTALWILYDPNKFHIDPSDTVAIFNEYFTDDSIDSILKHPFMRAKYKIFISDIRTETDEDVVFNEMLSQQLWAVRLNADITSLKFRLPYVLPGGRTNWYYDLAEMKKYSKLSKGRPCNNKDYNVCYLAGDIMIQIMPPIYSTETRLFVKKPFKMRNYDAVLYESKLFYYNTEIRKNMQFTYKNSDILKTDILNFSDSYESISQYYIIEQFLTAVDSVGLTTSDPWTRPTLLPVGKPTIKNIADLLLGLYKFHSYFYPIKLQYEYKLYTFYKMPSNLEMYVISKKFSKISDIVHFMKKEDINIKELISNLVDRKNILNDYLLTFINTKCVILDNKVDQIKWAQESIKCNTLCLLTVMQMFLKYVLQYKKTDLELVDSLQKKITAVYFKSQ